MLHPCLRIARSIHYDYYVLNRKTHKTTKERTPLFLRGEGINEAASKENVLTETGKFWLVSTWVTLEAVENLAVCSMLIFFKRKYLTMQLGDLLTKLLYENVCFSFYKNLNQAIRY